MNRTATQIELSNTARLIYQPDYLCASHALRLYNSCLSKIPWEQSQIAMFGKRVAIPRLNSWYGDGPYTYSGTTFDARAWTDDLLELKKQIEDDFDLVLNSALANLYRDGNDSMGWHSDDEKMLGPQPQIASVSVGVTRRFVIRSKQDKTKKFELQLTNGSLLLMLGDCQREWQHSIPKTTRVDSGRINLTFRRCYSD